MKNRRINIETVKNLVEIVALFAAAAYFSFRLVSGWIDVSLSLDVATERIRDPTDKSIDILAVNVRIKNGDNGSVRIADAVVSFSYGNDSVTKTLQGIVRYDFADGKLIPGKASPTTPRAGLGPGMQIVFSTYTRVPTGAVCSVDVTVLGKRYNNPNYSESRSAVISLPLD